MVVVIHVDLSNILFKTKFFQKVGDKDLMQK